MSIDVVLKRFENPDETLTFPKGRFEIVRVGGMTIGRATYEPGWRWSEHIGKASGARSMCMGGARWHRRVGPVRTVDGRWQRA